MPAYMVPLPKPTCRCGKVATHRVFNAKNSVVAEICRRCGEKLVDAMNADAER